HRFQHRGDTLAFGGQPVFDHLGRAFGHGLATERKRIAAVLEPMLMILVGAMVLVIVLAVLLPIFDLQAVVGGP
ncbi:MAG: type II secretion system F family protein, partial [Pseudomonadota bacterium]